MFRCKKAKRVGSFHAYRKSAIFSAYMRTEPNPTLIDFERQTELGPTFAARLLGLPYISYAQYRSGTREIKPCHIKHIEVILLLDGETRKKLIQKEVHGNRS
jgi:hypothetical protein